MISETAGYRKTDYENLPEANEVTYVKGSVLGSLLSVVILVLMIPEILGFHFYQEMGGNTILSFFRPWILLLSVVFVNGILWMASEGVIRKITKLSCIESATYDGKMGDRKIKHL